jgi:outer membrane protein, heavy metal efflux system
MLHSSRLFRLIRHSWLGAAPFLFAGCSAASSQLAVDSTTAYFAQTGEEQPEPIAPNPPEEPEKLPPPMATVEVAGGMSLAECEQLALEQHPKLASAAEAITAADGRAWQAGRPPNPQIGTSSGQWAGSQSQYNTFISQDVIGGGKLKLDAAAGKVEADQMRLAHVRATFDVLTAVRRQFYRTLAAQRRVEQLDEIRRISAKSAQIGRDLLKAGEGARPDVLILEVEAKKAEVAQQNAQISLSSARQQLAIAIGNPDLSIGSLVGDLMVRFPELDSLSVQAEAFENNAELARADAEVRRSSLLLERAIVQPKPDFNIMGGYQYQLEPLHNQAIFQFMMSVPLWDRNRGGIDAARANHLRAHADFEQTRLTLAGQATDALNRYRQASEQVRSYETELLPRTKESLELTQQLYEKGQADFLDVLAVQRTLQEVNLSFIDALEARAAAAADLGGLLQMEQFP